MRRELYRRVAAMTWPLTVYLGQMAAADKE